MSAIFSRGREFSPWAEVDPNAQYEFSGPEIGVGQKMSWQSTHPEVGIGPMTVTEYEPDQQHGCGARSGRHGAGHDLFRSRTGSGGGTKVTWGFNAALQNPLERWMCVFLDFDAVIGKDYEKGLAKLKALWSSSRQYGAVI